jgi:hypothetical protein
MTLFIGGPWDGQQRATPDKAFSWNVNVRQPMRMFAERAYVDFSSEDVIRQVRYNKLNMYGVEIFAADCMTPVEVMRELVKHYKSRSRT